MGWSQAKRLGRRTVTPSASRICTKASTSRSAFLSISSGQRLPPSLLKKSHCVLSWTTAGEIVSHGGMRASSTTPTMISSRGSHSLQVLTGQTPAAARGSAGRYDQQRAGRRVEKRLHHGAVAIGEAAVPRQHLSLIH